LQKDPKLAQFYRYLVQISLRNLPVQNGDQIRKLIE